MVTRETCTTITHDLTWKESNMDDDVEVDMEFDVAGTKSYVEDDMEVKKS
jgi:hypothetical protein